jgi:hypothetical protein
MHLSELVLEITRKCNLRCAHCLRGAAQRKVMDTNVVFKTLYHVESIGNLVITGGEPSLAPEVIHNIWQSLLWHKVDLQCFYIVSNGQPHNKYRAFLEEVDRLYGYCDDKGSCSLTISADQYHPNNPDRRYLFDKYGNQERYYGEAPEYFHPDQRTERIYKVLNDGRARDTLVGTEPWEDQEPWKLDDDYIDGLVYVSCNGNVTSSCNMSFHRIDKEHKGNVLEKSLLEIIEGFSVGREKVETEVTMTFEGDGETVHQETNVSDDRTDFLDAALSPSETVKHFQAECVEV